MELNKENMRKIRELLLFTALLILPVIQLLKWIRTRKK